MTIYLLQFTVIALLSLIENNNSIKVERYKKRNAYLIVSFLLLGLLMALRDYHVGADTANYSYIYERIANTYSLNQAFTVVPLSAPVYIFFIFLLSRVFAYRQAMIIACSIIICYGMYVSIKRSSKKYSYSVMLFVLLTLYFEAFNGARQMISVVLAINAYWYLKDNFKSIRGWLLYVIAIGVHNIAIFFAIAFIGVLIATKEKNTKKLVLKMITLSFISTFAFGYGIELVTRYFPRYLMYVQGDNPESIFQSTGGGRIALLYLFELIIIILYVALLNGKSLEINIDEKKDLPALLFCCICGVVFARNTLIQRLLWYYQAMFVTSIPNMILSFKPNNRRIVWGGIVVVLFIYMLFFLVENKGNICPYRFL